MQDWIGQLPKEAWGAIGIVVGALLAYIGVRRSSSTQEKIALFQAEKDIQIHREKLAADLRVANAGRALEKLEDAHVTLSEVGMAFSLTGIYFTDADKPIEEFRQWYLSYCRRVERVSGILALYVPECSAELGKLYGQMNVYWGEMEGSMIARADGKREFSQTRKEKAFAASSEISGCVHAIKYAVETLIQEKLKPL